MLMRCTGKEERDPTHIGAPYSAPVSIMRGMVTVGVVTVWGRGHIRRGTQSHDEMGAVTIKVGVYKVKGGG